jgi:hypothetical protein
MAVTKQNRQDVRGKQRRWKRAVKAAIQNGQPPPPEPYFVHSIRAVRVSVSVHGGGNGGRGARTAHLSRTFRVRWWPVVGATSSETTYEPVENMQEDIKPVQLRDVCGTLDAADCEVVCVHCGGKQHAPCPMTSGDGDWHCPRGGVVGCAPVRMSFAQLGVPTAA